MAICPVVIFESLRNNNNVKNRKEAQIKGVQVFCEKQFYNNDYYTEHTCSFNNKLEAFYKTPA